MVSFYTYPIIVIYIIWLSGDQIMSNDKKIIRCRSTSIDLDDLLDGKDFADVKRNLDRLEDKIYYGQGETAKFRVEATYSGEYVYLDVFREETDAEYDARLKKSRRKKKNCGKQKKRSSK